jgi:hypothetical protein
MVRGKETNDKIAFIKYFDTTYLLLLCAITLFENLFDFEAFLTKVLTPEIASG